MSLRGGVFPESNIIVAIAESRRRGCLLSGRSTTLPHSIKPATRLRSVSRPREVISSLPRGEQSHERSSVGQSLRLGGLADDGSYREKFIVRWYEVGINKTATIQTIANFLQEVLGNHFLSAGYTTNGFSTMHLMRKLKLIWVASRMHIEVYKYPAWKDVIEIETWIECESRTSVRRDWILRDYETGQVIGRATSRWMMINSETRRLQKINDDLRHEILHHSSKSLRSAFPPEKNTSSMKKIEKLTEHAVQYSKLGLKPRRADLDMNQQVNNVTFIEWLLESVPREIICSHELERLTLDYRRECKRDDVIDSLTSHESTVSDDGHGAGSVHLQVGDYDDDDDDDDDENGFVQFRHLLRLSGDGSETNRGRTLWRKKAHNK